MSLRGWLPENQPCFLKMQWEFDTCQGESEGSAFSPSSGSAWAEMRDPQNGDSARDH